MNNKVCFVRINLFFQNSNYLYISYFLYLFASRGSIYHEFEEQLEL